MTLSTYFPDRPPTWLEVLIGLSVVIYIPQDFMQSLSWPAVIIGFVVCTTALGPASELFEEWLHRIGSTGRLIGILLWAFAIVMIGLTNPELLVVLGDIGLGVMSAVFFYMLVYVAQAGTVSGWIPN